MRTVFAHLKNVPHLFGKIMVIWCVAAGTLCSLWSICVLSRTGQDVTGMLTVILAFFGGELGLMFGKNALESKQKARESAERRTE